MRFFSPPALLRGEREMRLALAPDSSPREEKGKGLPAPSLSRLRERAGVRAK
jgi:hypothetical protein